MYLSEPRDGGSSASCLVVWADDGFLAISLFFSLYFPTFQIQLLEIFFYITSYSITTKYIVTVLRCTPAGKKGKTLFFTLSIEIKASWSYFMMSLASGVSRRALCNGWSARTR